MKELFELSYQSLKHKFFQLFDNWKYYFDGKLKSWIDWGFNRINIRTLFQYRWRDAKSQLYSQFDWVEDIKTYSKYEIWVVFSFKTTIDYLY